jgi:CubicO group peptidase (beta-lactamase class C family)
MDRRRLAGALATFLLLAAACTSAPAPPPAPVPTVTPAPTPTTLATQIDEYIDTYGAGHVNIRSVRVQVDGTSRLEYYRQGADATSHLHVWSVTKSVVSILIGIAIAEGKISGTDATLAELLPDHAADMTKVQRRITLEQLLTMSGGLPDDEQFDRSTFQDSVANILDLPLQSPPGEEFIYSNVGAHLVNAVLAEAVGESPIEYGRKVLFDPLGIDTKPAYVRPGTSMEESEAFQAADFAWATDADGVNNGCCMLKLTADDMVALGQLYLDQGRLGERVIVPADWVRVSTQPSETALAYGYLWWLTEFRGARPAVAAAGAGGQMIMVVPDLRAVITVASAMPADDEVLEPDHVYVMINEVIGPALS